MRKVLLFLLVLSTVLFAQDWKETYDVWNDLAHTVQSADSVYLNTGSGIDSLVILGVDTVHIFIPQDFPDQDEFHSNGAIRIWGIGTRIDTLTGSDSVFFDIGSHTGNGVTNDSRFTVTYQRMDTCVIDSASYGQFDIHPMSNTTLQEEFSSYYDLRIIGQLGKKRYLYMKIEWMRN